MKYVSRAWLAAVCLWCGCGGLEHIPDVTSEGGWRKLAAAQPAAGKTPVPVRQSYFVAVFDIQDRSGRLKAGEVDGLSEYLAGRLAEGGRLRVIPRDQIKQRLLEQKKKSYRSCYDQSCQIEIGREMAAQKALSTVIASVGSSCLVTAVLYDLRKAASEATASSRGGCNPDDIVSQIERIVEKLVASLD